jgi:hypothetical protein
MKRRAVIQAVLKSELGNIGLLAGLQVLSISSVNDTRAGRGNFLTPGRFGKSHEVRAFKDFLFRAEIGTAA